MLVARILSWFRSIERPNIIFMPRRFRRMQALVESGVDPDDVPGIEELWLWRFSKRADAFARSERKFFAWLEEQGEWPPKAPLSIRERKR